MTATAGRRVRGHQVVGAAEGAAREATFRGFYEAEFGPIHAYLIALTGNRWVAEDLTQETFSRAYRNWDEVRTYDRPGAWARRVAHNLAMSRFRTLSAEARAVTRLRNRREPVVELPEEDAAFWAEVRKLPSRQAQAIALHYVQDLSIAQIAEVMDCAEGTAKAHLHRGRTHLARRLGLDTKEVGE